MREIKFRAYDAEFNKMHYNVGLVGNAVIYEFSQDDRELDFELEHWGARKIVPIMQYTGLHDKNGKEIYEGDILLFNNSYNDMNRKWKCVVKYREGSFVCEYLVDGVYNHFDSWNVPKVTWEVIGNIYENPELLEVVG